MIKIISKKEYNRLIKKEKELVILQERISELHRWFSGWKDLDILFNHLGYGDWFGGIELARKEYAKVRGTDEYGKKND